MNNVYSGIKSKLWIQTERNDKPNQTFFSVSIAAHIWGKKTTDLIVEEGSSLYALARTHCPLSAVKLLNNK